MELCIAFWFWCLKYDCFDSNNQCNTDNCGPLESAMLKIKPRAKHRNVVFHRILVTVVSSCKTMIIVETLRDIFESQLMREEICNPFTADG